MKRLDRKICLVTGAGQGIGRRIAERFLEEGALVIATDVDEDKLDFLHEKVSNEPLDVTNENAINIISAKFPQVDVLVNCAGYVASGTILESSAEQFDRSMALNVRSVYLMTAAFLPGMVQRRNGSIINVASVVSSVMAAPSRFAYGTSKAAVIGLTMSVAKDFASEGVRCNAISPGTVETPSLKERLSASGNYEAAREAFVARQLLGRLGTVDEIASIAVLLASDEAGFMTGSNVVIDGGMSL
ncbi:SDR family oxidoreductase [Agrobacterium tumefaciens]|uniref:SDR family oxidoreductase n=1 Tax=Agrobacterium tumefaciens TaxID=358 RepID=UPI001574EB35|nr:SDR family oxidoreductase [Agrobacterium tumefaciens]NTE68188.1 SDR family oxidoreductase [Agrobacterium tumefaciens]